MKTVANLKDAVAGILTGTNLTQVTNLDGALERAARSLAQHADVPESSARESYMLYAGVYDYPAPDTIFGGAVCDLRPQGVSRTPWETVTRMPIERFDITKGYVPYGYSLTFEWVKGNPIMRVSQNRSDQALPLDPMSDSSDWTPVGGVTALSTDTATFYQAPASIRFNAPTAGGMERTLQTTVDMSEYEGVASVFMAVWLPSADVTSLTARIGSDSSNYAEMTATSFFSMPFVSENFLLARFDLSTATSTGTPDFSAIGYLHAAITPSAPLINVRFGPMFAAQPFAHELLYYTPAIFLNSAGSQSESITDDDDQIVLNSSSYTIYEYLCAWEIALQGGGMVSQAVRDAISRNLHDKDTGLLPKYRADNPSGELREVGSYYDCWM